MEAKDLSKYFTKEQLELLPPEVIAQTREMAVAVRIAFVDLMKAAVESEERFDKIPDAGIQFLKSIIVCIKGTMEHAGAIFDPLEEKHISSGFSKILDLTTDATPDDGAKLCQEAFAKVDAEKSGIHLDN